MKPSVFRKQILRGDIPDICLLYGEEPYLIEETLGLIRRKLLEGEDDSFAVEMFDASESDAASILHAARTVSLFGRNKLLIVKGVHRVKAAGLEPFLSYLEEPAGGTVLVFTAEKPDMRKQFFSRLKKKWPAIRFYHPYGPRETEAWIREYLKGRGCRIEPEACRFLVESHGRELQVLRNELEKLILFKGEPGGIELSHVLEVSGQSREFNPFEFAEAMGNRDFERALRILQRLLQEGTPPLLILSVLVTVFRRLWIGKSLQKEGMREGELLSTMGVHFQRERFLEQLRRFSEEEVERIYGDLLAVDESLKSGQNHPRALMERLIFRVCRPDACVPDSHPG